MTKRYIELPIELKEVYHTIKESLKAGASEDEIKELVYQVANEFIPIWIEE